MRFPKLKHDSNSMIPHTVPQPTLGTDETNALNELRHLILSNECSKKEEEPNNTLSASTNSEISSLPKEQKEHDDKTHSVHSDRVLIRFLRARKGNVEDAADLWADTCAWRSEHNVSRWRLNATGPRHSKSAIDLYALNGFGAINAVEKYPDLRLVAPLPNRQEEYSYVKYVVNEHFGHDRDGHPLYWERTGVGAQLFPLLCKDMTHDDIIRGHIRQQELALAKCEEASIQFNKYIGKQTVIMDMKGLSLWPR